MTSWGFTGTKRLTAGEGQALLPQGRADIPTPTHAPSPPPQGQHPVHMQLFPAKVLSQFSFGKAAVVAKREEFASFLPSLPGIFPKGKKE